MSKNLIPIIAKELGVEIGEDFEVEGSGQYRFTETTLEFKHSDGHYTPAVLSFNRLNEDEIIKLPFEPKYNEEYWSYGAFFEVEKFIWYDCLYDYKNKKLSIVFRTKEEAIAARPQKYRELTGKDWEEE